MPTRGLIEAEEYEVKVKVVDNDSKSRGIKASYLRVLCNRLRHNVRRTIRRGLEY